MGLDIKPRPVLQKIMDLRAIRQTILNKQTFEGPVKGKWQNGKYLVHITGTVPVFIWDEGQWYRQHQSCDDGFVDSITPPNVTVLDALDMVRLREFGMAGVALGVSVFNTSERTWSAASGVGVVKFMVIYDETTA